MTLYDPYLIPELEAVALAAYFLEIMKHEIDSGQTLSDSISVAVAATTRKAYKRGAQNGEQT